MPGREPWGQSCEKCTLGLNREALYFWQAWVGGRPPPAHPPRRPLLGTQAYGKQEPLLLHEGKRGQPGREARRPAGREARMEGFLEGSREQRAGGGRGTGSVVVVGGGHGVPAAAGHVFIHDTHRALLPGPAQLFDLKGKLVSLHGVPAGSGPTSPTCTPQGAPRFYLLGVCKAHSGGASPPASPTQGLLSCPRPGARRWRMAVTLSGRRGLGWQQETWSWWSWANG